MVIEKRKKVTGSECLKYINKPIGLVDKSRLGNGVTEYLNTMQATDPHYRNWYAGTIRNAIGAVQYGKQFSWSDSVQINKFNHDPSKRIVGWVSNEYDDGGIHCFILGNEKFSVNAQHVHYYSVIGTMQYIFNELKQTYDKKAGYNFDPGVSYYVPTNGCNTSINDVNHGIPETVNLIGMLDYNVGFTDFAPSFYAQPSIDTSQMSGKMLTPNATTSLEFGKGLTGLNIYFRTDAMSDPLALLQGDFWGYAKGKNQEFFAMCPPSFDDYNMFNTYTVDIGDIITSTNLVATPYNIILTRNLSLAQAYLSDGILPSDAFLYPLDWDELPRFTPDDDPDDDDNPDDDEDDGDDGRDVDPTPLTAPIVTPQMLDANNVYWLGVGEYGQFLNWFWFDIQQFSVLDPTTWDNLSDNILGLYNNLAETVVAVRFMPIKPKWVGDIDETKQPIKLGMIQDYRTHDVFNKYAQLEPRLIGSIDIPNKFNNYKYLNLSPYSQLSLYLPFYGFADLDIDMFTGHKLTVYAVYDILSGSIVYYVYYDDTALVNYYMAKISVDVPITLQTAYDRDRAMNQNITESIVNGGSLLTSIVGGNPIGMTLAAGNLASAPSASAPMLVKGYGSEQGILFTPSKCAIYLRRPTTVKKGSAFKSTVGNLWCRTARLSNLSGFTQCQNPHITFRGNTYVTEEGETTDKKLLPLAEEIEEIYDYLTKGVIL